MASEFSPFALSLLHADIRRLVEAAIDTAHFISAAACAAALLERHPTCGLSLRQIEDYILLAAGNAGVAVEFGGEQDPKECQPAAAAGLDQAENRRSV